MTCDRSHRAPTAPARPAYVDRVVVLDDDPPACRRSPGFACCWRGTTRSESPVRSKAGAASTSLRTRAPSSPTRRARPSPGPRARRSARCPVPDSCYAETAPCGLTCSRRYLGLCDALGRGRPPLLLVPALPSAGRVTREGVHLIERGGRAEPLHETEYAGDGVSLPTARLLEWAESSPTGSFERAKGESCTSTTCGRVEPTRWPPHSSASRVRPARRCSHQTPRRRRTWRRSRPATRRRC